ncbi:MAG TPA: hypothetical protein VJH88_05205 [Candidatus Nanoarchaeia archaeon]|nr:hypothetical protein [Candidatus Nanoarchaeia archaeon]
MSHDNSALLKKYGFEEEIEEVPFVGDPGKGATYHPTGFPKPTKRYRIIWEGHELNLEEPYYWVHMYYEQDLAFPKIIKTEDAFAAAENSAFFGVSQQRLGAQQDKISQYLATIGKMVKELFQLVRELRILDERIIYYEDSNQQLAKPQNRREKAAEITLKGIFIDLVQGGAKNTGSVYGMARELEFTTLPDLFFDAPPMKHEEVDQYIDKLDFNRKVIEVVKRHLKQFIIWKERTWSEINTRRRFTLQYLRQHYEIIKMYMIWVKPYLRHTQRLTMKKGHSDEPEIVSAFESSMIDVEMLGIRPWKKFNTVIITTFNFRTHPSLKFVQEGYQRGPIHVGTAKITFRGYIWTKEQIDNYVKMKEAEDFELLKTVSAAVQAAMDALGDELLRYLEEAGQDLERREEHAPVQKQGTFRSAFFDILGPKKKKEEKAKKKPKEDKYKDDKEIKEIHDNMKIRLWLLFKNFKKGHGMLQW